MFLHTVPYCILRLRKFVQLLSLHYTEVSVQIAGMASLAGAPYISVWEATDEEILQKIEKITLSCLGPCAEEEELDLDPDQSKHAIKEFFKFPLSPLLMYYRFEQIVEETIATDNL